MQSVIRAIYPPQCVACGTFTEADFGLCGACWRDCGFIGGTVCEGCGLPLPGAATSDRDLCDDCLTLPRPWARGRAVMEYRDTGRRLVLALKHGDRTDLARSAGAWMARVAETMVTPDTVVVPIPLHWTRLLRRRFNQAALLSQWMTRHLNLTVCPDALIRPRRTRPLEGHDRDARFAALDGAIRCHPRRGAAIKGKPILLVDDVMTSGATLTEGTKALLGAGAAEVSVLTLARVTKRA
jgi:ComF family protein